MELAHFIISLLQEIPYRGWITSKEIQSRLEDKGHPYSRRQIQRRLKDIAEDCRFPIELENDGRTLKYKWRLDSQGMNLPGMRPQESLLLSLAHSYLQSLLPPKLLNDLNGLLKQADYNIGSKINSKENQWMSKVRFIKDSQPLLPPVINDGVFETVSNALYLNKYVNIKYVKLGELHKDYKLGPLGLAQQGQKFYLVAKDETDNKIKTFALQRIIEADESTITFDRPENFDLKQYDDNGRFCYGDGEKVKITFNITPNNGVYLLETPLSTDQQVIKYEKYFQITATVVDSLHLDWFINKYGDEIEVISKVPIIDFKPHIQG